MNPLQAKVKALDQQILDGDILGAVDTFFHPDVETQEGNAEDVLHGKAAKKKHLQTFFEDIAQVNGIHLHSYAVGDDVTMSEFTFDLTRTDGIHLLWNEVLRRRWQDGLVISERYYTAS
ncbi:MAG TPA: hypothetical protein VKP65_01890 [Rhodothermales bacterium]|nr:hypothetical protein [Rhodothermales bacterium]